MRLEADKNKKRSRPNCNLASSSMLSGRRSSSGCYLRRRPGRVGLLFSFGASPVHNVFPMELHRSLVNQRHLLTVALVVVLFYVPTNVHSTELDKPQQVVFELNYPLRLANSSVQVNPHDRRSDLYNLFKVKIHPLIEKKTGLKVTLQSLMTHKFVCMKPSGLVYTWKPRNRQRKNRWRTIQSEANEIPVGANDVIKEIVEELAEEYVVVPPKLPQDCYFLYVRSNVTSSHSLVSFKHTRPGKKPGHQEALYMRFQKNKTAVGKWFRHPLPKGHALHKGHPNIRVELQSLDEGDLKSLVNNTPFRSREKAVRNCLVRNAKNPFLLSSRLEDLTSAKLHSAIRWCRRRIKNRRAKKMGNPRRNEITKYARS